MNKTFKCLYKNHMTKGCECGLQLHICTQIPTPKSWGKPRPLLLRWALINKLGMLGSRLALNVISNLNDSKRGIFGVECESIKWRATIAFH